MTCGHCGIKKKKAVYKCESCGKVSDKPGICPSCGKPMKKQK